MNNRLTNNIKNLISKFELIPDERKERLYKIKDYICEKGNNSCNVNFICTHNSRRSQISQMIALAAAKYYNLSKINFYSGGTEATSFNYRAVQSLKDFGFDIFEKKNSDNSVFVWQDAPEVEFFSKVYTNPPNPKQNFCAIMTCSEADANCPMVLGAEKRVSLPFVDPKEYDNKPNAQSYYNDAVQNIGLDILFSLRPSDVKTNYIFNTQVSTLASML